nr:granzyme H-like isoform X2 [Marmota flaviventris]
MKPLLLLLVFLLCPRAEAGKIIGGQEAVPHSHPHMAFIRIQTLNTTERCGGFLVCEDFVVKAAHCWGSSINVTLWAHNTKEKERSQPIIPVKKAFPHPDYNSNYSNDIMLLQGDSGSPFVCKNVAQGIVSFGQKEGTPPSVYTGSQAFSAG